MGISSCPDACASMGGSTYFDPSIIEWKDREELENEMGCEDGMEWSFASKAYVCAGGSGDSYINCRPNDSWCCTGGPGGGKCDTLLCLAGNPGCYGVDCTPRDQWGNAC